MGKISSCKRSMCVCMYVFMCVCMYVFMCVCMYVCIYVYIQIGLVIIRKICFR